MASPRLSDTRDEVAALKELLQNMLQLEDAGLQIDNTEAGRVNRPVHLIEEPRQETACPSDGYSPVALDEGSETFASSYGSPLAPLAQSQIVSPLQTTPPILQCLASRQTKDMHPMSRAITQSTTNEPRVEYPDARHDRGSAVNDAAAAHYPVYASRRSVALLRRSDQFEPDFQARVQRWIQQSRQKKDEIRKTAIAEEQKTVRATPAINARSKQLRRNVSHLFAWNAAKEHKVSRLRGAAVTHEMASCARKLAISSRSRDLFADRQDEIARCKVEDRLQLLGLVYEYEKDERLRRQKAMVDRVVGPVLAPHSSSLSRCSRLPAYQRLHEQFQQKPRRNDLRTCEQHIKTTLKRQNRRKSDSNVVRRLYVMADRYKQKRVQMSEHQAAKIASAQCEPIISKRSRRLAHKKRRNAASNRKSARVCACCGCAPPDCKHDTTRPGVSKQAADAIFDKQVRWLQQREAKRLVSKHRRDELELQECTFRNPCYRSAWDTFPPSSDTRGNGAFYNRSVAWANRRDQHLDSEKKIWQELEMMECTFQPRLPHHPSPTKSSSKKQPKLQLRSPTASCYSLKRPIPVAPLPHYTTVDLEALASTSSCPSSSTRSMRSSTHESRATEAPATLYPRFTCIDANEFAGR